MKLYFYKYENERFKMSTYPIIAKDTYLISTHGRIFSNITNKFLTPTLDKEYLRVKVKREDVQYGKISMHRLVAWEFCEGFSEEKYFVNHKDGDTIFNNYINLEWATPSENTRHAIREGLMNVSGENSNFNKYSEDLIHSICSMLEDGLRSMEIMSIYGYTKENNPNLFSLISSLKRRKTWHHVTKNYDYESTKLVKHPTTIIHEICRFIQDGLTNREITNIVIDRLNLDDKKCMGLIKDVRNRKSYVDITRQYNF